MTDKIQQARRAAFETWHQQTYGPQEKYNPVRSLEHWPDETGLGYQDDVTQAQFFAFCAALDCVVIELPAEIDEFADGDPGRRAFSLFTNTALRNCRAAIESTNLGIKVK